MDILLLRRLCIIGLLSGALGVIASATPQGKSLEENFGLAFLFKIQGNRTVPDKAVICAIEKKSADFFGLKQQPYKWPRTLHAQTINKLTDMNVAAIGLDMFLEETRSPQNDKILARAMRNSGKVVLLQRLKETTDFADENYRNYKFDIHGIRSEQLIPPVPILKKEALALAPFPLPKLPVRLNQAWLFKEGAGEKATLPVTLFTMSIPNLLDKFIELVKLSDPSITDKYTPLFTSPIESQQFDTVLQKLRTIFLTEDKLALRMKTLLATDKWNRLLNRTEQRALRTMINLFNGNRSIFINYYGPPGTINTIPYYKLFQATKNKSPLDLQGKTIFIGLTHDTDIDEKDGFYTVFTDMDGHHISGVEVAATVFANLVDGSAITPVDSFYTIIAIFLLGIGIGAICIVCNSIMAGVASFCLCMLYVSIACSLFTWCNLWLSFVVPVTLQAPLTYLSVTLFKFTTVQHHKENIRKALQCYIPKTVAAQLEQDFSLIASKRDMVHGICLFSDLENYTVLSENAEHSELNQLINAYYEEIFHIVKQNGGMVLDIRGDSMLALWLNSESGIAPIDHACLAAFSISRIFNNPEPTSKHHLPTRLSLHQGNISLGNIGALDHYQYTITGDTVNTAARIESLNKQLGTKLLVSKIIAQKATSSEFRKIGTFLFVGKSQPLTIYELIGRKGRLNDIEQKLSYFFSMGLKNFQQGKWSNSLEMFELCTSVSSKYGPALWFQRRCKNHINNLIGMHWDGVIRLENK